MMRTGLRRRDRILYKFHFFPVEGQNFVSQLAVGLIDSIADPPRQEWGGGRIGPDEAEGLRGEGSIVYY